VWGDSNVWADAIVWGDATYDPASQSWADLAQSH